MDGGEHHAVFGESVTYVLIELARDSSLSWSKLRTWNQ
jgi:hypothetical protein